MSLIHPNANRIRRISSRQRISIGLGPKREYKFHTYPVSILAYAAGILDGEGSISLHIENRRKRSPTLEIRVTNRNKEVIEFLKIYFYGTIQITAARPEKNANEQYRWGVVSKNAEAFLKAVAPHVIVKKRQLAIALEFMEHRFDSEDAYWTYVEQMRNANKRGLDGNGLRNYPTQIKEKPATPDILVVSEELSPRAVL